jgi:hypothetical protein
MSKPRDKHGADGSAPQTDTLEQEEFLTRWSRRKALAREGAELPEPDGEIERDNGAPADDVEAAGEHPERETDAPAAAPELPPIESLDENSDYAAFLAAEVPADMQRKALRKLFRSPKFNVRDGLDDYDLDFSSPEPLGDIVTAEMRHRLRAELERLAGLGDDDDGPQDAMPAAAAEAPEGDDPGQPADNEPDDDEPATA